MPGTFGRQRDIETGLRYTAGMGLDNTPVGPIRTDYGQKLNKKKEQVQAGISALGMHFKTQITQIKKQISTDKINN